jgi:hypothetical protein
MGEGQNVSESTGGFLHPQNCNFPEESFILISSCNSVFCNIKIPSSTKNYYVRNVISSTSLTLFHNLNKQ